jgi:hypothetical protein
MAYRDGRTSVSAGSFEPFDKCLLRSDNFTADDSVRLDEQATFVRVQKNTFAGPHADLTDSLRNDLLLDRVRCTAKKVSAGQLDNTVSTDHNFFQQQSPLRPMQQADCSMP